MTDESWVKFQRWHNGGLEYLTVSGSAESIVATQAAIAADGWAPWVWQVMGKRATVREITEAHA